MRQDRANTQKKSRTKWFAGTGANTRPQTSKTRHRRGWEREEDVTLIDPCFDEFADPIDCFARDYKHYSHE